MLDKKKGLIIWGILIAILLGLSFYFDNEIVKFFSNIRNIYFDNFFLGIKFLNTEVIIVALLTLLLLWKKKKREWILPLWITMGITTIITVALKIIVHRIRPFAAGLVPLATGIISKASYSVWDFSFPSGDTSFIFCAVPILSKLYPKLKYLWIGFAVLVGLSRVYFGLHYPSDVVSGALIGLFIGMIIVKTEEKTKFFGRIYNKIFKK